MEKKELALAVNFGKAPKELQDLVRAADAVHKKHDKVTAQIAALQAEQEKLVREAGEADKRVRLDIAAWDPNAEAMPAAVQR